MQVRVQKTGNSFEEHELNPGCFEEYDVWVPSGHVLFVKEWDYSVVLIASAPKKKNDNQV